METTSNQQTKKIEKIVSVYRHNPTDIRLKLDECTGRITIFPSQQLLRNDELCFVFKSSKTDVVRKVATAILELCQHADDEIAKHNVQPVQSDI